MSAVKKHKSTQSFFTHKSPTNLWEMESFLDVIALRPILISILGMKKFSHAILLSQLWYWFRPSKNGKRKLTVYRGGKWWLAKTYEQLSRETGIPEASIRRVVTELRQSGYIEVFVSHYRGVPTNHYWFNDQKVFDEIRSFFDKNLNRLSLEEGEGNEQEEIDPLPTTQDEKTESNKNEAVSAQKMEKDAIAEEKICQKKQHDDNALPVHHAHFYPCIMLTSTCASCALTPVHHAHFPIYIERLRERIQKDTYSEETTSTHIGGDRLSLRKRRREEHAKTYFSCGYTNVEILGYTTDVDCHTKGRLQMTVKGKQPPYGSTAAEVLAKHKERGRLEDNGIMLKTLWVKEYAGVYGHCFMTFTKAEVGQLGRLVKNLGRDLAQEVIRLAIRDWPRFGEKVKSFYGLSTYPMRPVVGFLLKYHDVAIEMVELKSKSGSLGKSSATPPQNESLGGVSTSNHTNPSDKVKIGSKVDSSDSESMQSIAGMQDEEDDKPFFLPKEEVLKILIGGG